MPPSSNRRWETSIVRSARKRRACSARNPAGQSRASPGRGGQESAAGRRAVTIRRPHPGLWPKGGLPPAGFASVHPFRWMFHVKPMGEVCCGAQGGQPSCRWARVPSDRSMRRNQESAPALTSSLAPGWILVEPIATGDTWPGDSSNPRPWPSGLLQCSRRRGLAATRIDPFHRARTHSPRGGLDARASSHTVDWPSPAASRETSFPTRAGRAGRRERASRRAKAGGGTTRSGTSLFQLNPRTTRARTLARIRLRRPIGTGIRSPSRSRRYA